ncbi:hypothetical protein [Mucilaginibacter ginsenosidivorans]|uniref:Pentapeptide MXKDX repeat protein n=1 Tax=Mucilaginibacter ginsenosidivorans TaxID=398053 RepID=A0A5B8UR11_9SPHI|nr:hypothetical protein [Mucilaginibacter ginsenosidivorans]QEC61322.1 hypothetical protein FRZ54_01570 [Mucilaginibacter ginsenosidivorans]
MKSTISKVAVAAIIASFFAVSVQAGPTHTAAADTGKMKKMDKMGKMDHKMDKMEKKKMSKMKKDKMGKDTTKM